jgi:hypothetical protein
MIRYEIMSSVTCWLGCVAVLWGASTPLLAQRELPLPSVSERASTQPQPEKPRELRRPEIQVLDRKELRDGLVREKLCLPRFHPDETVPAIAIHPASGGPFPVAEIKQAVSKLPQRKKLALVQWLQTQVDDRLNDEEIMTLAPQGARALDKRETAYAKRKARTPFLPSNSSVGVRC